MLELPDKIEVLFDPNLSDFYDKALGREWDIDEKLFYEHFIEVRTMLISNVEQRMNSYQINKYAYAIDRARLIELGFSVSRLKLKMAALDFRWRNVLAVSKEGRHLLFNDALAKPLKKFLEWLNSILGSLSQFIPGVEPLKELNELIENHPRLD